MLDYSLLAHAISSIVSCCLIACLFYIKSIQYKSFVRQNSNVVHNLIIKYDLPHIFFLFRWNIFFKVILLSFKFILCCHIVDISKKKKRKSRYLYKKMSKIFLLFRIPDMTILKSITYIFTLDNWFLIWGEEKGKVLIYTRSLSYFQSLSLMQKNLV